MVLICGDTNLENSKNMQICFLEPKEIPILIDEFAKKAQVISVADVKRGKLRVWGSREYFKGSRD